MNSFITAAEARADFDQLLALQDWQPMNDSVLIKRLEPIVKVRGGIYLTDDANGNGPLLREGVILACGPGRRDEDGARVPLEVRPGMKVLFNARWNDFANQELRGSGSDRSGALERPLPIGYDATIHLVQEADIAGILS